MSNQAGQFSMFDFGPRVVDKKARYRDEDKRNKLSYNFQWDPRLRRGHNFGVVYVTNATQEEETSIKNRLEPLVKNTELSEIKKKRAPELDVPEPPPGRNHLAVNTLPVTTTIKPKPLTFNIEVQTDEYIDRPQTPLFWPEKTGVDVYTQIEDGELFNFDEEVEPILNCLLSKTLEQSRMEVLEEEEIKEMKAKQRYFEELRNRELMEVERLEDAEKRRFDENSRRQNQQKERLILNKTHQKKLYSRVFAKQFLSKLQDHSIKDLEQRGIFRNPLENEYQNNLLPFIYKKANEINNNDFIVVNELNESFKNHFLQQKKNAHKQSLLNEVKRLENLEIMRLEEIERRKEEKKRRKEEILRLKRENELKKLKQMIETELISQMELNDDPQEVFDISGFHTKSRKACPLIGTNLVQIAFMAAYVNKTYPDYVNEERLIKVLDALLPKSTTFYIAFRSEDLEFFKTLEPSIAAIEDVLKLDETLYGEVTKYFIENFYIINENMESMISNLANLEVSNVDVFVNLLYTTLLKYIKSPDSTLSDKVKFILKDPVLSETPITAICDLNITSIAKPKTTEANTNQKKPAKKQPANQKFIHEYDYYDKSPFLPFMSENNCKIICISQNFEKMIRYNILDCINKLFKIEDLDKEAFLNNLEESYRNVFITPFVNELAAKLNKEIITIDVDLTPQQSA